MPVFEAVRVEVSAEYFDGSEESVDRIRDAFPDIQMTVLESCPLQLLIHTLEGTMTCGAGHYIIRGLKGEYYPCREDIFNAKYKPKAEEVPDPDIRVQWLAVETVAQTPPEPEPAPIWKLVADMSSWDAFRAAGLLWWVNRALHLFGWSIVVRVDDNDRVLDAYPSRTEFRGFPAEAEGDGFTALTKHLAENAARLKKDVGLEEG